MMKVRKLIIEPNHFGSPINSGDEDEGHWCSGTPASGQLNQGPFLPAQFSKPPAISFTPISITVEPVAMGGKTPFNTFGGVNDSPISKSMMYPC